MNLKELMASTPPMQQHTLIKGFQAGAASRDAEIAQLNKEAQEKFSTLAKERDQPRAELVNALAACKAKDAALRHLWNERTPDSYDEAGAALAIQPDDSALKAWLGAPVAWEFTDAFGTHYTNDRRDWTDIPGIESVTPLYSPKGLK